MKILFGIQGTGNGHISRAREVIPHLMNYGEVDLLISGTQAEVTIPYLVKFRKYGISFTFGKKGGVDMWDTVKKLRPVRFIQDVRSFPVNDYDVVINDFEPVSAWACKLKNKPCIALSHQSSFLSPNTPRPDKKDRFAEWVFRNYAPVTHAIGFHFEPYDSFIHTPVIRSQIREMETSDNGHITVYLPAYHHDLLISHFRELPGIKWEVFSKHCKQAERRENVFVSPIDNEKFNRSLASCSGALLGGGFEGPAEALFMGKKLFVIPMSNQYEQVCNALAARKIGVTGANGIHRSFSNQLKAWIEYGKKITVNYPDITGNIIGNLFQSLPEVLENKTDNNSLKSSVNFMSLH